MQVLYAHTWLASTGQLESAHMVQTASKLSTCQLRVYVLAYVCPCICLHYDGPTRIGRITLGTRIQQDFPCQAPSTLPFWGQTRGHRLAALLLAWHQCRERVSMSLASNLTRPYKNGTFASIPHRLSDFLFFFQKRSPICLMPSGHFTVKPDSHVRNTNRCAQAMNVACLAALITLWAHLMVRTLR